MQKETIVSPRHGTATGEMRFMRQLRGLSVFVASPGGLDKERKMFYEILNRFNQDVAHESGITFLAKGHELAFAGAGRPQELINAQVRDADYLVVVFWDKWGMPTSSGGPYTSGTEEEYAVGVECLEDADRPMRDVAVLFKGVDDRQMSDPGPQLQKVLDFKSRLEIERRVLYRTFDNIDEFGDALRTLLGKWARDWNGGEPEKAPLPPAPVADSNRTGVDESASLLDQAKAAAKLGQTTRAHQLYTQATTGTYDRESWTQYVRFLRRTGRHGLLQSAAAKMIEQARNLDDHKGSAEGLMNLGIAKRSQGHRPAALDYFDKALEEVEAWDRAGGSATEIASMRAFILDNWGLTLRRMRGRLPDAVLAIRTAIELHDEVGDARGKAHGLRNIGIIQSQIGDLDASLDSLQQALDIFEKGPDEQRAMAMTLSSMGETLELRGDMSAAIDSYERALALNTHLNNRQGKSMNLSQLSRALLAHGDLHGAEEYAQACLETNEKAGSPEGLAAGLNAVGRVELSAGNYAEAEESLKAAHSLFIELDQPAGVAATALALAETRVATGDTESARDYLNVARNALDDSPHFGLSAHLREIEDRLA